MLRKLIKRLTPTPETLRNHPSLRFIQHWLHDPNLWHLNRYSVSTAVFIGFFIAFVPLPVHMIAAALLAIWWRANLPVAVGAVWISNPVTIPPQFYIAYKIGAFLLRHPQHRFTFELSLHWARNEFDAIWQPLLLGCLICGLATAALGWIAMRILWRIQATTRWRARQYRRAHHKTGANFPAGDKHER
ncbi:MAG TPA: DUF2062 domain-containing protein [Spongiibacteraceae bacterium]|nr:DUF2062 domain-containing protein [Spongiibacteraceae bacterium]